MFKQKSRYVFERYQLIFYYTGIILIVSSLLLLLPFAVLLFYPEESVYSNSFLFAPLMLLGLGSLFRSILGSHSAIPLNFTESGIVVLSTWLFIPIFSAAPYMLVSGMTFTQAIFDSVSGWTTTGLSTLDVTNAPKILLFFRTWTQFLGGAGMAIIMIASITGINANHLYTVEGKGYLIKPSVKSSARIVVLLYVLYFFVGFFVYYLLGMNLFDAITHCFAAISTGGFSNYPESIGYYQSFPIEFFTLILMIFGSLNFVTVYFLVKKQFNTVFRNGEMRLFIVLLPIAVLGLFLFSSFHIYPTINQSMRIAIFESISALTTTGFSIANYQAPVWNDIGIFFLVILMLIGGGTCSTAGGIKQYRIYLMYKSLLWQLKRTILPRNAVVRNYVWEGEQKKYITSRDLSNTANFISLYFFFYLVGVVVIMITKNPISNEFYSLRQALFEFASSISTVGLSIGVTSASTPSHITWLQTIGMLLGRLEFIVVILAISKILSDFKSCIK